jgi:abnormal spindle-like microcephaly-associated protein
MKALSGPRRVVVPTKEVMIPDEVALPAAPALLAAPEPPHSLVFEANRLFEEEEQPLVVAHAPLPLPPRAAEPVMQAAPARPAPARPAPPPRPAAAAAAASVLDHRPSSAEPPAPSPARPAARRAVAELDLAAAGAAATPLERQERALAAWMNAATGAAPGGDAGGRAARVAARASGALWRLYSRDAALRAAVAAVEARVDAGHLRVSEAALRGVREQARAAAVLRCFSPFWLRLGGEVAVGARAAGDLDAWVRRHLLEGGADAPRGRGGAPDAAAAGRLAVKRVALLVALLDRAAGAPGGLPRGAPPVLRRDAPLRSTAEVLREAVNALTGEADAPRLLARWGLKLAHEQAPLDTVDPAVVNLAVDLRDGLRLCRLADALAGPRGGAAIAAARLPAPRRPDRLHNVQLAIGAFACGARVSTSGVPPAAVVNGDRAATVRLLWRLVFAVELPRLLDAGLLRGEAARLRRRAAEAAEARSLPPPAPTAAAAALADAELAADAGPAAALLLALLGWADAAGAGRGARCADFSASWADGRLACAVVGAHLAAGATPPDGGSPEERWAAALSAAGALGGVPGVVSGAEFAGGRAADARAVALWAALLAARLVEASAEERAATAIQRAWRARQALEPGTARAHLARWVAAARVVQRSARAWLLRRALRRLALEARAARVAAERGAREHAAAARLQAAWRGHVERAAARRARAAAAAARAERERASAVALQTAWRRCSARRAFLAARAAAAARAEAERRAADEARKAKAVRQYTRHMRDLAFTMQVFAARTAAAKTIQAAWRGYVAGRHARALRVAQRAQRATLARREAAARAVLSRWVPVFRARVALLQARRAAAAVQQARRRRLAAEHAAAAVIVRHARAWLGARELRAMRRAALVVQAAYRGHAARAAHPEAADARTRLRAATAAARLAPERAVGARARAALAALAAAPAGAPPPRAALEELAACMGSCGACVDLAVAGGVLPVLLAIARSRSGLDVLAPALRCLELACGGAARAVAATGAAGAVAELLQRHRDEPALAAACIGSLARLAADPARGAALGADAALVARLEGIARLQVSSAASLVGQSKQKTSWKPTNRPTNHSLITDHCPK